MKFHDFSWVSITKLFQYIFLRKNAIIDERWDEIYIKYEAKENPIGLHGVRKNISVGASRECITKMYKNYGLFFSTL